MLGVVRQVAGKFYQVVVVKGVGVYRIKAGVFLKMTISAEQKLRKVVDFKNLQREGVRFNCGGFFIVIRRHSLGLVRFGVIASRKVGNAVRRNRAKRVFREIFRLNQHVISCSCDFLVVVRSNFEDYSYGELQGRFLRVCEQI